MTTPADAPAPPAATAGSLLRQARQAQGMHIAVLATAIKVTPRKLEALENDRFDELPDATFTRALAQTVCRTLKIDPAPVLALLPRPPGHRLEHVGEGINAPFRERPGMSQGSDWSLLGSPAVWAPLLSWCSPASCTSCRRARCRCRASARRLRRRRRRTACRRAAPRRPRSSAMPVAAAPAPAASIVVETVHSVPAAAGRCGQRRRWRPPRRSAGVLQLRVSGESWVEVLDGRGQTLLSRLLQPGEAVGVDGAMPMKLTIGNAGATQVSFRGRSRSSWPATRATTSPAWT